VFFKLTKFVFFALLLFSIISLGSCAPARTILQQANLSPDTQKTSKYDAPNAQDFKQFQDILLGAYRLPTQFELKNRTILSEDWLNGRARVEERTYSVSHGPNLDSLSVVFIHNSKDANAPLLIAQNFTSNRNVVARDGKSPLPGEAQSFGVLGSIFGYFFGRYIVEHPYEDILDRGYSIAVMHPPQYVPDRANLGLEKLDQLFPDFGPSRPGALSVWASLMDALAFDIKSTSPNRKIVTYGHSRYGKTALIATAMSDHIDGAISHQSGTVGASILRDKTGESLADIVNSYPHWVAPLAREYADNPISLPIDAPALLAKIAPKPVLLGNARRDVWSDPEGAYIAAKIAAPAWGADGFNATRLDDFRPEDRVSFWIRPGTHGVVKEDWPAFLDFLDAHFK